MNEGDFFEADVHSALERGVPVLAMFTAGWCGACEAFEPIFQDVVSRLGGSVRAVTVDTDRLPELAAYYRISIVPTTLLIRDERTTTICRGPLSRKRLLAELSRQGVRVQGTIA